MRTIQISEEDYEFLKDLQHELNTQENDGQADPIYWSVMDYITEGVPDGCGDAYVYMGDGCTMSLEEAVKNINDVMNGTMIDYNKSNISETKIMDVFEYTKKESDGEDKD